MLKINCCFIKRPRQVWKPRQHNQRVHRLCWTFPEGICSFCSAGGKFRWFNSNGCLYLNSTVNNERISPTRFCWKFCCSTRRSSMWLQECSNRLWTMSIRVSHMLWHGETSNHTSRYHFNAVLIVSTFSGPPNGVVIKGLHGTPLII